MEFNSKSIKTIGVVLLLLTLTFLIRVLAQLTVYFTPVSFIADFDKWQSGTVPYWLLLIYQGTILSFMTISYLKIKNGQLNYTLLKRNVYLTLGTMYTVGTLTRHILGLTVLSHSVFFTSFISIYFHYVLASFLLLLGFAHLILLKSEK